MYKITAPSKAYDRKIGGLRFVNGEARTESEWLANWFSGRAGFIVESDTKEKKATKSDTKEKKADGNTKQGEAAASESETAGA